MSLEAANWLRCTAQAIFVLITVAMESLRGARKDFTVQHSTGAWGSNDPVFAADLDSDGKTEVFIWRDHDKLQ